MFNKQTYYLFFGASQYMYLFPVSQLYFERLWLFHMVTIGLYIDNGFFDMMGITES